MQKNKTIVDEILDIINEERVFERNGIADMLQEKLDNIKALCEEYKNEEERERKLEEICNQEIDYGEERSSKEVIPNN